MEWIKSTLEPHDAAIACDVAARLDMDGSDLVSLQQSFFENMLKKRDASADTAAIATKLFIERSRVLLCEERQV